MKPSDIMFMCALGAFVVLVNIAELYLAVCVFVEVGIFEGILVLIAEFMINCFVIGLAIMP